MIFTILELYNNYCFVDNNHDHIITVITSSILYSSKCWQGETLVK